MTDKIIEWIFFPIHIQPLWMIQTREIITFSVSKIHKWIWGDVYDWGKFFMEWQVTDKIIEWIVSQFTFNLLLMTPTQEIINCRVSKIHEWIWGDVYEWGKVS